MPDLPWWRDVVVYEVYPRSFQDSNGDGIGDLAGITDRLDYLSWLGIEAIWICPFYASPMKDGGYDIRDFCAVDPVFGALDDFDKLLSAAHDRGIRVILDFVPNHTSDQHPWFQESRQNRTNPKRDWYVWRDGLPDGRAPTNWESRFGGSAWTKDDLSGQFYYHAFLPSQPDLNWRNNDLRSAMLDVLRFWIARGIDGFRVDAITNLIEDAFFRDEPRGREADDGLNSLSRVFTQDRPETHACVAAIRAVLDASGRDLVLIGEVHLPVASVMSYYGKQGFNLPFNFILLHAAWDARSIAAAIDRYEILLPEDAWPNWVLGNHDEPRIASRIGVEQARNAAMLIMTLRGTPFIYYGDELGLADLPDQKRSSFNRNPSRSPMPWDQSRHAGFTTGDPWLPLDPRHEQKNVRILQTQATSILHLYRALIALRKKSPALRNGEQAPLQSGQQILAFRRSAADSEVLVLLNLTGDEANYSGACDGRILLSTRLDRNEHTTREVRLRPHEGVIVEIDRS